jgi:multidrug efflux pump subunit AcrA (membrane-fusion protein)
VIRVTIARRALVWLGLVFAGIVVAVWQLQGGAAAESATPQATATRDDLVVSVGGVGRIVDARSSGLVVPATGGGATSGAAPGASGTSSTGAAGSAPADAVFPHASGHVLGFLVVPGQQVVAGQPLALLDDRGTAAFSVMQAQNALATALLDLRQKRINDPTRGHLPTPAEVAVGRLAVATARARLERLLHPARPADVSAARLDVKRAEAELETLRNGSPAARAEAIRIARRNVELANQRLERILAPPDAAELKAAEAEVKKAEADLAVLLRPQPAPLPEAVAAARRAVTVAQENLADAKAATPPDPAAIRAAELELDKAVAELAGLLRPAAAPLAEEIAAARTAAETAHLKLARLKEPAPKADVTAARLELDRARAELRALEAGPTPAGLAAARQAIDAARAKLAQLLGPGRPGDVTMGRLEIQRAQAHLAVLRARGRPSAALTAFAELKVRAARARLTGARLATQLLTVRAPSDGTVTALLTIPGAPVDASTPIAAVADLDRLAVSVDLSEFDVAQVRRGLNATVSVDALGGKSFTGRVLFAALSGNDNGGVVTFPVRVGLKRAAGLRPGMNVSVRIIVAQHRDVVQVPLDAVASDDEDRPIVTVLGPDGETTRRVTLGLENNKNVEIVKGLKEGERVMVAAEEGGEEE